MVINHLHVHTEYSALDGIGSADDYVKRALEIGSTHIAETNHGNINGSIRFQQACVKGGIIPIIGTEAYIVPNALIKEKGEQRAHITLLCKNEKGWQNLLNLLTYANVNGFYTRPRIDVNTLCEHSGGLVAMSACLASFMTAFPKPQIRKIIDAFPKDLYLEIMPLDIPDQPAHNQAIMTLAKEYKLPLIATNDCHYPNKGDDVLQEVLLAIQRHVSWDDPKRWKFDTVELYMKSAKEMISSFNQYMRGVVAPADALKAIEMTREVSDKCGSFRIAKKDIMLPPIYEIQTTEDDLLWDLCMDGWNRKLLDLDDAQYDIYYARLLEEFDLLTMKKFSKYFFIVHELLQWCRANDIEVGCGRGSVGGSLVAWLLDITMIDPIKYNLLFFRFISPDRNDYPDIDIDISDTERGKVLKHLAETYGENNVAKVSTAMRMKVRMTIRDVGRVFNLPAEDIDLVSKSMEATSAFAGDEEDSEDKDMPEEWETFKGKYPDHADIITRLVGQLRGVGTHAAALILSDEDLRYSTRTSLIKSKDEFAVNWDMQDCEYAGLIKLDVLGLAMLTVFHDAMKMIKENHGVELCLEDLDLNDQAVYKQIQKGKTVGAFQIGTRGIRAICSEVPVSSIQDMSDIIALYRPGPIGSGMVEKFIMRKNKKEEQLDELDELLMACEPFCEITRNTHGLIIYQEQVMMIVHDLAGFTWSEADKLRKIIGKKRDTSEFMQYEQQFIDNSVKRGHFDKDMAKEFYGALAAFAGYGFNMAHSIAYAITGYWGMWFKTHYPAEFMAASLSSAQDKKIPELIYEARMMGLKIQLPKIGISKSDKWFTKNKILYAPFIAVKGIGDKAAMEVETLGRQRKGFAGTYNKRALNSRIMEILKTCKADVAAFPTPEELEDLQEYFQFPLNNFIEDAGKQIVHRLRIPEKEADQFLIENDISDLLKGQYSGGKYTALATVQTKVSLNCVRGLKQCRICPMAREPIMPMPSRYNRMILFEAPNYMDDSFRKLMQGDSGELVEECLERKRYNIEQFHITSIFKCYAGKGCKIKHDDARPCFKWINQEFKIVNPFIVFAMGNASVYYFKGEAKGIRSLNGTTEWDAIRKCWICWGVSPTATYASPTGKQDFITGMDNFIRVMRNFSVKKQS